MKMINLLVYVMTLHCLAEMKVREDFGDTYGIMWSHFPKVIMTLQG